MSDTATSRQRVPCQYKCLRCAHLWDSTWIKDVMEELSCPECGSNSQWRISEAKKKGKKGKKDDDADE